MALACGVVGVVLVHAGHVSRAWRWGTRVGPFLREAGVVVGLYALWQLAGNLATGGFHEAITHGWQIWDAERTLRFEVDSFRKQCLLNGWDDIALTLLQADKIRAFEANRLQRMPWLAGGPHCGERVRRLSRLGDSHDQDSIADHRIAVAVGRQVTNGDDSHCRTVRAIPLTGP